MLLSVALPMQSKPRPLPRNLICLKKKFWHFFFQNILRICSTSIRVKFSITGKIYFGRSQVRDVAVKRLSQIDDYCKVFNIFLMNHIHQPQLYQIQ